MLHVSDIKARSLKECRKLDTRAAEWISFMFGSADSLPNFCACMQPHVQVCSIHLILRYVADSVLA